ncbi:MAG TPA: tRNA preQ1(34) S-adenosylmethionine ribosyltransferase-isomerase QueA [Polyangiaceae bacterium]
MRTELFDYNLPHDRIALRPLAERDAARLLVLRDGAIEHRSVRELSELVPRGALLVVNDTRVLRARLFGQRRPGGGRVEILLLRREGEPGPSEHWQALGRASKALRPGTRIDSGDIEIEVLGSDAQGLLTVAVQTQPDVETALDRHGRVPIPPYLAREDDADDVVRYQTIYARHAGSVAAPTAGLHFSNELLERVQSGGVELGRVTLHVGLGTFKPVAVDDLEDHRMHHEWLNVSQELTEQVARARGRGAQVIAVGTTVVRALESARDEARPGFVQAYSGDTDLFIRPGYRFHVVDGLLTNFHMPKSTLLALVSAFAGTERVRAAYRAALAGGYRFLSYGDAMWIPERLRA